MSDIVRKLRNASQGISLGADGMGWSPDPHHLDEAADEIERLRSRLAEAEALLRKCRGEIEYQNMKMADVWSAGQWTSPLPTLTAIDAFLGETAP